MTALLTPRWTVLAFDATCGACRAVILAGEAVLEMRPEGISPTGKMRRCDGCAAQLGHTPNETEINLERFRLETDRERVASHTAVPRRSPAPSFRSVSELLDHKVAAANDRDE